MSAVRTYRKPPTAKGRDIRTDPTAIDDLLRLSQAPEAEVRRDAVQYLCPCHVQANHPEVWDRLCELTGDEDLGVRRIVFHILGDGSPRERSGDVVHALQRMYHDPDPKLRRRVRQFLAQYRRTGRINIL